MKDMKLTYETLQCELIEVLPEGVLCASTVGTNGTLNAYTGSKL